jgi:2-oxo-4-hydroxy-4-carboxy--5-ureidoimidazoline (OHCU) decarboxylase
MDREDIIRMARNEYGIYAFTAESLAEFATIIAAAERNKLADWMIERGYATGHGDTIEDLLVELEWQVRESEREACVQIIEEYRISGGNSVAGELAREWTYGALKEIRDDIRVRGNT